MLLIQYKSNVPHPKDAGWGTTLGVQGRGKRNSRFRIMPMVQHLERERRHHGGSRGNSHFRAGGEQPASGAGLSQLIFVETAGTVPWRMIWCIPSIWLPTIGFLKAKMIIFIAYTYLTQHLVVKKNQYLYVDDKTKQKHFSLTFRLFRVLPPAYHFKLILIIDSWFQQNFTDVLNTKFLFPATILIHFPVSKILFLTSLYI